MTSPTEREQAENEAAEWLLVLAEHLDDEIVRERFELWCHKTSFNAEIWERTRRAYDLVGRAPAEHQEHWSSYATEGRTKRALPTVRPGKQGVIPPPSRLPIKRRGVWIGALCAVCSLAAVVVLSTDLPLRLQADAMSGTGQTRDITLADGSKVMLAPRSAIAFAFRNGRRDVRLLRGEAFFEVVHNAEHPFSVATDHMTVTDVGTAFDVARNTDSALVSVEQGKVNVRSVSAASSVSFDLEAGEAARVPDMGIVAHEHVDATEVATWRSGALIVRDQSAEQVINALRNYYHGAVLLHAPVFAKRRVTGVFDLRHPEQTLRELAASHAANVRRMSPWLLVVTDG
ncbi:FecR family protein [Gluconacetobacter sp.]|uniref:FecR family protein n=1 Tax=Gluconacetobacter sp. TaxID=1935994 RepID=UPI0039E7F61A